MSLIVKKVLLVLFAVTINLLISPFEVNIAYQYIHYLKN